MTDLPPDGCGRRKYPRLNVDPGSVSARVDAEASCSVKNVSHGGAFLLTGVRYPIDTLVELKLTCEERRMHCTSRIAHLQREGMGLEFLRPPQPFRGMLTAMIDELLAGGARFERRREHRVPVSETIVWEWKNERAESPLSDISIGGAMIGSQNGPPTGSTVRVFLRAYVPTGGTQAQRGFCDCAAEVLRHGAEGFAVSFKRPPAAFNMAVAQLLSAALVAERKDRNGDG